MPDSNEFLGIGSLGDRPTHPSIINYGSNFHFLRAWGQRIDARLQLLTPLHKWDMGVFRPDTGAEKALINYGANFPQVVRPVWDRLDLAEAEYRECEKTNFKETDQLAFRFGTLETTIRHACTAIKNALIAEMDFFELGDEILALLKERASIRDIWMLINEFEIKRRCMFDIPKNPEIWSGCDIRREPDTQTGGHCLVVVTGHPTIPDSYHIAYIWDDQILDDSEDQELRDHISSVVSAWIRTGKRLTKASLTEQAVSESQTPPARIEPRVFTSLELEILNIVAESNCTMTNPNIHSLRDTDSDLKSTKETVRQLCSEGFLHRPNGSRKGVTLSDQGREALKKKL